MNHEQLFYLRFILGGILLVLSEVSDTAFMYDLSSLAGSGFCFYAAGAYGRHLWRERS